MGAGTSQIKKNQNAPGLSKHEYLLKNLCVCGRCGSNFCGRTRPNKKDHYYYCSSRVKTNNKCGIRSINIDTLESLIWMIISTSDIIIGKAQEEVDKLKNPEHIQKLLKEKDVYKVKIASLTRARETLLALINSEDLTEEEAKNQLAINKMQTNDLKKALSEIDLRLQDQEFIARSINYAQQFLKDWDRLTFTDDFELKNSMVRLFIDKITIDFDDIEEVYTITVSAKLPHPNNLHTLKVDVKGEHIESRDDSNKNDNNNSTNSLKSSKKKGRKVESDNPNLEFTGSKVNASTERVPPKAIPLHQKWYDAEICTA